MTMYQPGDRVRLRTTGSAMLAGLIDPDASCGVVVWLIEIEGGPRILAREDQFWPADGADMPLLVEG